MFLSAAAVEAATDYGTAERLPEPGAQYVAACDPAGHGEDAFTMSVVKLEGAGAELRVTQVFQKAWDKPRSGLRDLEAVVADCAEHLRRYGLTKVFGDRSMSGWVLEAFRRRGVEYAYPHLKRDGAEVYGTRSLGYLEAAPLLRAGRARILDDERTRRELRNLEQRGEKVDHPAGLSDDRANSLMLAICMAVQSAIKPAGFAVVESYTKNWIQPVSGRVVDRQGTRYLGDGNFMTSSGERYRDPRYS